MEEDNGVPINFDFLGTLPVEQPDVIVNSEVDIIIKECRQVIQAFSLERLVKEAQRANKFSDLIEPDQEMFCAGLIKLGEALTFCRDKSNRAVKASGISDIAKNYATLRNYFAHKHIYNQLLETQQELQDNLKSICTIERLNQQLEVMQNSGFSVLTKKISPAKNFFDFEYEHFVICLKQEALRLKQAIEPLKEEQDINESLQIYLDNRVRNILTIMLDLADEKMANQNKGKSCKDKKETLAKINMEFVKQNDKFSDFFSELKANRNALSHLDRSLTKPYDTKLELIEFAKELNELLGAGYLHILEKIFLTSKKQESTANTAPEEPQPPQVSPTQKKAKTGLERLLVYNVKKAEYPVEKNTASERKEPPSGSFSTRRKK